MKSNKHRNSGIVVLGSWVWMIVLLILLSFDKTITLYFFGISIGILVLYNWLTLLLRYAIPYIENNQRKSNQNKIFYILQMAFRLSYRIVVYLSFLLIFFIVIMTWFGLPIYFLKGYTGIYYKICLPLLGGIIGEVIWGFLYFGGMIYLGYLVYEKIIYRLDKYMGKILNLF